jgi:hypothetical protein
MANELLDFVMSLVRDPEVAARYAADPAGAIAAANLANVTSADVNNLIPMVADSLSMAAPTFGAPDTANVWASGAATAAFDAFDVHVPQTGLADLPVAGNVIDTTFPDEGAPVVAQAIDDPVLVNDIVTETEDVADALGVDDPAGWAAGAVETLDPSDNGDSAGFDLF